MSLKPGKFIYKIVSTNPYKAIKLPNPQRKKGIKYRMPRKPRYCLNKICYECFEHSCPFLATGRPPDDEYKKIMKKIAELY